MKAWVAFLLGAVFLPSHVQILSQKPIPGALKPYVRTWEDWTRARAQLAGRDAALWYNLEAFVRLRERPPRDLKELCAFQHLLVACEDLRNPLTGKAVLEEQGELGAVIYRLEKGGEHGWRIRLGYRTWGPEKGIWEWSEAVDWVEFLWRWEMPREGRTLFLAWKPKQNPELMLMRLASVLLDSCASNYAVFTEGLFPERFADLLEVCPFLERIRSPSGGFLPLVLERTVYGEKGTPSYEGAWNGFWEELERAPAPGFGLLFAPEAHGERGFTLPVVRLADGREPDEVLGEARAGGRLMDFFTVLLELPSP